MKASVATVLSMAVASAALRQDVGPMNCQPDFERNWECSAEDQMDYNVQSGDNCAAISNRFGVATDDIYNTRTGQTCAESACLWVGDRLTLCGVAGTASPTLPPTAPTPAPPPGVAPEWVADALYSLVPMDAAVLQILNPEGLWDAIYGWDTSELGSQNKMFYGTVEQNKYQLAAFLANIYVETLVAFLNEVPQGNFNPNYGLNELVCDDHVGFFDDNGTFVQEPSPCVDQGGGNYGLYWGRGAIQVTCRVGSAPDGGDFCPAYADLNIYYKDYIESRGWDETTIEREPYHVALDPTLAWGSAIAFWMVNTGHGNTGCYTSHQWSKLQDFAGTIETINGGWANGECPLGVPQQRRIDAFLIATNAIGLNPRNDGWNGIQISDACPCEVYFDEFGGEDLCYRNIPNGVCDAADLPEIPTRL
jgi:hypothetical protein